MRLLSTTDLGRVVAGRRRANAVGMNLLNSLSFLRARGRTIRRAVDAGMTTAEYAVGTIAAVAFAVVLITVVRSDEVRAALAGIVRTALNSF
jgi:hypothetical protein